jgi:hypothetical protein
MPPGEISARLPILLPRGHERQPRMVDTGPCSYPETEDSGYSHRVNVVVLAGTVSADPVQRRMPSGDEVTELRLSVPEAVLSPHNSGASAQSRPALVHFSTPFMRFWLAAKRSGVRIPLGPLL